MSFTNPAGGSFTSSGLWGGPPPSVGSGNPFLNDLGSNESGNDLFGSSNLSSSLLEAIASPSITSQVAVPVVLTPAMNEALERFIQDLSSSLSSPTSPPIPSHLPPYIITQILSTFHLSPSPSKLECYEELGELCEEYLGGRGGEVVEKVWEWIKESQEGGEEMLKPKTKLTSTAPSFTPLGSANAFQMDHQQHPHIPGNATPPIGIQPQPQSSVSYNANAAPFVYGGSVEPEPIVDMGEEAFPSLSSSIGKEAFPVLGSSAGSGNSGKSNKRGSKTTIQTSLEEDSPKPPLPGRPPIPPTRERKASNAGSSPGSDLATSLAASLFSSTTRPRSNSSIQSSSPKSPVLDAVDPESFINPRLLPDGWFSLPHGISTGTPSLPTATQTKVNTLLPYLHSLHPTISQPALQLSLILSRCSIPLASYLLDRAGSLPPICRHLLSGGCYRSDCIYSHDMSRHTCTFWLRGRCKEVDETCKFFHGFGEPGEAWEEVKEEYEGYYGTEGVEGHYGAGQQQQGFEGGEYEGEAGVLEWGGPGYEPHEEISHVP